MDKLYRSSNTNMIQLVNRLSLLACVIALSGFIALCGCGGGDGPELADAGGVVTYHGKPIEGANVVFIPDSGPAAYGTTNAEGRFVWTTREDRGAAVGPGKVAITAVPAYQFKSEAELTSATIKKMGQSLIPTKYGRAETSGLTVTVESGEENDFTLALKD